MGLLFSGQWKGAAPQHLCCGSQCDWCKLSNSRPRWIRRSHTPASYTQHSRIICPLKIRLMLLTPLTIMIKESLINNIFICYSFTMMYSVLTGTSVKIVSPDFWMTAPVQFFPQKHWSIWCWMSYHLDGHGGWDDYGCKKYNTSSDYTTCLCNHLTHFGILLVCNDLLCLGFDKDAQQQI